MPTFKEPKRPGGGGPVSWVRTRSSTPATRKKYVMSLKETAEYDSLAAEAGDIRSQIQTRAIGMKALNAEQRKSRKKLTEVHDRIPGSRPELATELAAKRSEMERREPAREQDRRGNRHSGIFLARVQKNSHGCTD